MTDVETAYESKVCHHAFTVSEYYKMAETGILSEEDRVELLGGEIIDMPPIGSSHASVVDRLNWLMTQRLPAKSASLRTQGPLRLDEYSEPVPDFALLQWRDDFYATGHPAAENVLLLVEVAVSSVSFDRGIKMPIYASHGISEYWLISLPESRIEVYREPSNDGYKTTRIATRGEPIAPLAFPDVQLKVDEILG